MNKQVMRDVLAELKTIRTDDMLVAASVGYCIHKIESNMRPRSKAPYQAHSETSFAAALEITPHVNALELKVLQAIHTRGVLSDEDGQDYTGLKGNTYRPRRSSLADKGLVKTIGRKIVSSGRSAWIWALTAEGHKVLEQ